MTKIAIFDATGICIQSMDVEPSFIPGIVAANVPANGSWRALEDGETVIAGKHRQVNGRIEDYDAAAATRYVTNRIRSYPPVGEQLDALWHAMDKGLMPAVEPFYSQIKAVKTAHPKPSN